MSDVATDDLTAAAAFMLGLVDQYYGTDHEFDIPEEAEFRYYRAVIEEATMVDTMVAHRVLTERD